MKHERHKDKDQVQHNAYHKFIYSLQLLYSCSQIHFRI
jgi:hypothetical protein